MGDAQTTSYLLTAQDIQLTMFKNVNIIHTQFEIMNYENSHNIFA